MKSSMRKIFSLIIVLSMCIMSLSSCGKKETVKETTVAKNETVESKVETTAKKIETERALNPDIKVAIKEVDKKQITMS